MLQPIHVRATMRPPMLAGVEHATPHPILEAAFSSGNTLAIVLCLQ
jgi:hypothetical protein